MRSILAAFALSVLPGAAFAACTCICQGGQAMGLCSLAYETPPICQRLCTPAVSQSIGTPNLATTIAPGSVYASPVIARGNAAGVQSRGGASVTSPDIAMPDSASGANATSAYGASPGVTGQSSAISPDISAPIGSYNLSTTLGGR